MVKPNNYKAKVATRTVQAMAFEDLLKKIANNGDGRMHRNDMKSVLDDYKQFGFVTRNNLEYQYKLYKKKLTSSTCCTLTTCTSTNSNNDTTPVIGIEQNNITTSTSETNNITSNINNTCTTNIVNDTALATNRPNSSCNVAVRSPPDIVAFDGDGNDDISPLFFKNPIDQYNTSLVVADGNCCDCNEDEANELENNDNEEEQTEPPQKNRGGRKKGTTVEAKENLLSRKMAATSEVAEKYIEKKRRPLS